MSPVEGIEQAFLQLAFAIKLLNYTELGKIDKTEFDSETLILLKRRNLSFRSATFHSYNDIIAAATNNYVLTLGATAIVLDNAFSQAGFGRDLPLSSPHRDLRAIVYMIRCAFAHDMMAPRWKATAAAFARELRIELPMGPLVLDMRKLNDQPFDHSQIGGFERYFEIKDQVEEIVVKAARLQARSGPA